MDNYRVKKSKIIVAIAIMLICSLKLSAQPNYSFVRYRSQLPTVVEDIDQDRFGRIWIASWNGLYRFDGKNFHNYKLDEDVPSRGFMNSRFTSLKTGSNDNIWLLTEDNTLYFFDHETEKIKKHEIDIEVRQILKTNKGDLFFVLEDGTILKSEATITEYLKTGDEEIEGIYRDALDNIWVYGGKGIFRNEKKVSDAPALCCEEYNGRVYFGGRNGYLITFDEEGKSSAAQSGMSGDIEIMTHTRRAMDFLIGSSLDGFFIMDPNSSELIRVGGPLSFHRDIRVIKDSGRNVWIYSKEGGLQRYDSRQRRMIPFYNEQLQQAWDSEVYINCAFVDMQDNLWIGGSWRGIEKATPIKDNFILMEMADREAASEQKSVRAVIQTRDGKIMAGTKDGQVHVFDRRMRHLHSWSVGYPVYDIFEDDNGGIWLAAKEGGIYEGTHRYSKGDDYYDPIGVKAYHLDADDNGRLWMAYFDESVSYLELDDEQRRFFSKRNRISFPTEYQNRVRFIYPAPNDMLYVCGHLGVFVCANPDARAEEIRFSALKSTQNMDVQHIFFDSKGRMFASSFGHGFLQIDYNNNHVISKSYTSKNGLLSDYVLCAIEDNDGNIWIATNGGLNKLIAGTDRIINYPYERIGFDLAFNEGEAIRTDTGELFFNTNKGLLHFDPKQISKNPFTPLIYINSCYLDGEKIQVKEGNILNIGRGKKLIIDFKAIDMTNPDGVKYSYRIGNKDWIDLGSTSTLTFEKLRPGKHTLHIRSTNAEGYDADNMISLNISVRGNYLLLALLIAAALAAFLTIRRILMRRGTAAESDRAQVEDDNSDSAEKQFINQLQKILDSHLDNSNINMEVIAAEMNMSRSNFYKKCRELVGKAPNELLKEARFKKAKELLKDKSLTIYQIAFMTGFNDSHYFAQAFKKEFGITPSEFRKG